VTPYKELLAVVLVLKQFVKANMNRLKSAHPISHICTYISFIWNLESLIRHNNRVIINDPLVPFYTHYMEVEEVY